MRWTVLAAAVLAVCGPAAAHSAGDSAALDQVALARCLAREIPGGDGRACMQILRAPCASFFEAGALVDYSDCAQKLGRALIRAAKSGVEERAALMPEAQTARLLEAIGQAETSARLRCEAAAPATAPLEIAHAARADCRLRYAALIAHLAEFYPERLGPSAPEET